MICLIAKLCSKQVKTIANKSNSFPLTPRRRPEKLLFLKLCSLSLSLIAVLLWTIPKALMKCEMPHETFGTCLQQMKAQFKVLVVTYEALHGARAQGILKPLLLTLQVSGQPLRSSRECFLCVPPLAEAGLVETREKGFLCDCTPSDSGTLFLQKSAIFFLQSLKMELLRWAFHADAFILLGFPSDF